MRPRKRSASGCVEDKLGIEIEAGGVTKEPGRCAVMITGGFAPKHQLHGLTILAENDRRAVCDEQGRDLLDAVSPNCEGQKKGRDCDFKDLTIFSANPPEPEEVDTDGDGVPDYKDACPENPGSPDHSGCSPCPDENANGVCDMVETDPPADRDTDDDGVSDVLEGLLGTDPSDADSDDDGHNDGSDCRPLDPDGHECIVSALTPDPPDNEDDDDDGESTADTDADGVLDDDDNCTEIANEDQADDDEDGTGDACDPDFSASPGTGGGGCALVLP
jgi:hypothetical protein